MSYNYQKALKRQFLKEADDADDIGLDPEIADALAPAAPAAGAIDPNDPAAASVDAAATAMGGEENLDAMTPEKSVLDRYVQTQQITDKLDTALSTQLTNRIKEMDAFVERLNGLDAESLISMLKQGAQSNENLETIYDREHRAIGKCAAQISSLSQNLKSYL